MVMSLFALVEMGQCPFYVFIESFCIEEDGAEITKQQELGKRGKDEYITYRSNGKIISGTYIK